MSSRRGHGEGSIFQRSDGRWCATVELGYTPDATGRFVRRRKTIYGRTRREVSQRLQQIQRDVAGGKSIDPSKQTVAQLLAAWLETKRPPARAAATYEFYASRLRHISPFIGVLTVRALTPQHVQHLVRSCLDRGLSPRSVHSITGTLHAALEQAVRWRILDRNVVDAVDLPQQRRREMPVLDATQARHLLDVARATPLYALYILALTAGLRRGELLALRWQDVDFTAGVVHIQQSVRRSQGSLIVSSPKSERGRRTIILLSLAVEALKMHRQRQLEQRMASGATWVDHDLIFSNGRGNYLDHSMLYRDSYYPLLTRAGLPRIPFHSLRHSCASLLLSLGVHPKVVQELLGHSQISLTLDTYSHVLPGLQREALEKLSALFP